MAFLRLLKERGLRLVPVAGDGNCLFRAIALQVYGTAEAHVILRRRCMDFIENSRATFEPFTGASFEAYVANKRKDGMESPLAWGGHVEVQAISEMFSTPIEIYDAEQGQAVNIFHQGYRTDEVPVRLSYHHGNHYNALIPNDGADRRKPISPLVELSVVQQAIELNDQAAIEDDIVRDAAEASIVNAVEDAEVQAVIDQQEREAIEASLVSAERLEEEKARAASLQQLDSQINKAYQESIEEQRKREEADLYRVLAESSALAPPFHDPFAVIDDDEELQRAMWESLR
ncbi:MAG: hypothetical protein K2Q09_02500 [Phycisphaerales bacterium]|nr:hypothetical protein [Phycisphaerales bacterium]